MELDFLLLALDVEKDELQRDFFLDACGITIF
jgi:hypothetical protein